MNLQAKVVPKLSQNRFQGPGLKAESQYLTVEPKEDKVHFFVLNGQVAQSPALLLELRQCIKHYGWDTGHELPVVGLRGEAVNARAHPRLY